jgi:hypothetical protein
LKSKNKLTPPNKLGIVIALMVLIGNSFIIPTKSLSKINAENSGNSNKELEKRMSQELKG